MAFPELTTFGALARYALELESRAASFYDSAASLGPLAGQLAAAHRERYRTVERARQQYLNEMILEPVTGLDGRRYLVDGAPPEARTALAEAIAIEGASERFYLDSASVAKALLAEAARAFRKLGEGNARHVEMLRGRSGP